MHAQNGTLAAQSRTPGEWKDRLLASLLAFGVLVMVVWNIALLAVALSIAAAVAETISSWH
jgi:uncharacterized membrane protein YkgB